MEKQKVSSKVGKRRKTILLISEIYTAFALLILYKEAHVWKQQFNFEAEGLDGTANGDEKKKGPRYAK